MRLLRRAFTSIFIFTVLIVPVASGAHASSENTGSGMSTALTDGAGPQKTTAEIAREMTNPLAAFYRFDLEGGYQTFSGDIDGADDQSNWFQQFRASIPFREKNGKGWVFRFSLPYIDDQPVYWVERETYPEWHIRQLDPREIGDGYWEPTHAHTDDVTLDLVYGGVSESGFILSYGIAGILPTSSDTSNARRQFSLGPLVNVGKMTDRGVYGALISHVIDVSDNAYANVDTPDMNQTTVQAYLSYGLGNGWQLVSNPVITYDWEGDSGNKLNLPLGGGIAKTTRISKMPLRVSAEVQYFVANTDRFGPDLLFKFSLSPLLPSKHTR